MKLAKYKCKFCKSVMDGMRQASRRKFCSPSCSSRSRSASTKPVATKKRKADKYCGRRFTQLVDAVKRAGSIQIISGSNAEELGQIIDILKFCDEANGYNFNDRKFEVCHIAPVGGKDVMGTLHPDNLVVAPARLNREHSSSHLNGAGRFIPLADVVKDIPPNATRAQVLKRIRSELGEDVVLQVIKEKKLKPSQREKDITSILKRCSDYTETQLSGFSSAKLAEIDAELKGTAVRKFSPRSPISELEVVLHEAKRLGFAEFVKLAARIFAYESELFLWSHSPKPHKEHHIAKLEVIRERVSELAFLAFHGGDDWQSSLAELSFDVELMVFEDNKWKVKEEALRPEREKAAREAWEITEAKRQAEGIAKAEERAARRAAKAEIVCALPVPSISETVWGDDPDCPF